MNKNNIHIALESPALIQNIKTKSLFNYNNPFDDHTDVFTSLKIKYFQCIYRSTLPMYDVYKKISEVWDD